jgi:uncharacterized protein (DUF2252 family)
MRKTVPRSAHGAWEPAADRPDPIDLLIQSSQGRLPDLVPIRYGRMLKSPFTFLRGSASIMACDLAPTPATGIRVQACGDCHLMNFGVFASPERNLIFDINDFDETLPAPWEWDLKRLATSVYVAGRDINISEAECITAVQTCARSYRERMRSYSEMRALEVWYARIDVDTLINLASSPDERKRRQQAAEKARTRTGQALVQKLTTQVDGTRRILDNPPLIYHLPQHDKFLAKITEYFRLYRASLQEDRRYLLDHYRLVDVAVKVVGVGSVGTRCAVALMEAGPDDYLVLQFKEARASVLEPYAGRSAYGNHGQRVVCGQRLMQSASDMFLGWSGGTRLGIDFYLRQLRDMKASVEIGAVSADELIDYAEYCGWALARAHAKSGDAALISGYLGQNDSFDQAMARFAAAYAAQVERDHAAMVKAVKDGRLEAQVQSVNGKASR